ncbi:MAG: hypothetical protein HFI90_11805 [Clostridia bacterium]|nr:hypothetical protein [Clostridia bacterium]
MVVIIKIYKSIFVHYSILFAVGAFACLQPGIAGVAILASVFIHELAHCVALKLVGEIPKSVIIHTFGVKIETGKHGLFPPRQMIPIAASGPLVNLLLGIAAWYYGWDIWVAPNIALAVMNLLPVFPLDGGQIFYSVLSMRQGRKRAKRILKVMGVIVGGLLALAGGYVLLVTKFNFTLLLIAIFILYTARKDVINPVMEAGLVKNSDMQRTSSYIISEKTKAVEAAGYLPATAVGIVIDGKGEVQGFVTASGLYHKMEQYGGGILVKECLR